MQGHTIPPLTPFGEKGGGCDRFPPGPSIEDTPSPPSVALLPSCRIHLDNRDGRYTDAERTGMEQTAGGSRAHMDKPQRGIR